MAESTFTLPDLDVRTLPGPDDIFRKQLPNGLTLLVRENFSSPAVVITGSLDAGALDDPEGKAGLSSLTALGLMRGTTSRSFRTIFDSIESIGASLAVGAGTHTTQFHGKALADDLGLLITLLADVLRNPVFPETEMDILRAQRRTALLRRDEDTGARAQLAFDQLAYQGHPYANPSDGFLETLDAISLEDVRQQHEAYFAPAGMIVAVTGAVRADDVAALVSKTMHDWDAERVHPRHDVPDMSAPEGLKRENVHLEGKSQADLIMGAPGPARRDADFLPAVLGNSILGRFGLYGRIGDAVRVAAGLAYYAYSTVSGGYGPGPWQVVAGVNPRGLDQAIKLIQNEISRFVKEPVSEEELLENKANFIGRMPLQFESNEGVAAALSHVERHQLGLDYYRTYPDRIKAITADDILAAAQRYLHPERLIIGVAGDVQEDSS